jgi:hypothetical protein
MEVCRELFAEAEDLAVHGRLERANGRRHQHGDVSHT